VEGHGPFRVHITGRDFLAQALLNTSGRWSNLTIGGQTQDAGGKRWLGVKAHFREPSPAPSVDLYFFEGGYCGVQPVRVAEDGAFCDRVNVCAMVRADVASNLEDVFVQHPAMGERCRQWRPLMEAVSTSPLVFHRPTPVLDGVFQAGDAAGFVDPFAGDGISLALRGGALAAEFITRFLHGEMSREDAEFRYREAYKQVLLPVFRNSARLRRLLRLPPAVRRPLARVLERAPALAGYLVRATR
jgi:flavin-dependent dehydrogenase